MSKRRCKLFDENIVHSIMLATGNSVTEYIRENGTADSDEIRDFVEVNFDDIIKETIADLKKLNDYHDMDIENSFGDDIVPDEDG
jgi:hypothetical protein